jgi:hypothetical protein
MPTPKKKLPGPDLPAEYARLVGSERKPPGVAKRTGTADPGETGIISVYVRRRPDAPKMPEISDWAKNPRSRPRHISREELAATYGALPADLEKVAAFLRSHGFTIRESNIGRRVVTASGTVAQMSKAFAVDLGKYESPTETFRGREGFVHLPAELAGIVTNVFGLDTRSVSARKHVRNRPSGNPAPGGASLMTPPQVAKLYNFPTGNANGQTIGIVEFGGGFVVNATTKAPTDIDSFYSGLGLSTPSLTAVSVDSASNSPAGSATNVWDQDPDIEVALDIDVAGSVAPGAALAVYFAPNETDKWMDAVTTAIHDTTNKPTVISISWGGDESGWPDGDRGSFQDALKDAALLGVTVLIATGDNGTNQGVNDGSAHVQYPASDPWALACGGTFIANVSGSTFTEGTWNDAGATCGGVSVKYGVQAWQDGANVPPSINDDKTLGRGLPDVSGNASPFSGYTLFLYGSKTTALTVTSGSDKGLVFGPVGGTSAVAPLYAGLVALINSALGENVGYINPTLYALAQEAGQTIFRDVADNGNNSVTFTKSDGTTGTSPGYTSGAGWDPCTGWGSIDGTALLTRLQQLYAKKCVFAIQKDTFGSDEVDAMLKQANPAVFPAFWVWVEGLTPGQLGINSSADLANPPIIPQVTLDPAFSGLSVKFAGPVLPEDPSLPNQAQRLAFPFNVIFTDDSGFTTASETVTLEASLTSKTGDPLNGVGQFHLVKAANPYVLNGLTAWLSTDLRVFAVHANESRFGATMGGNADAAPAFITSVIKNLTSNQGNVNGDKFDNLGDQSQVVTNPGAAEASEALYLFPTDSNHNLVFNFAVARVRLQGLSLTAKSTRVFFRLFQAQTTAVAYVDPGAAPGNGPYRQWSDGVTYGRKVPLYGTQGGEFVTIPCFGTARVANTTLATNMTTQTDPPNVQDIAPNSGGAEVDTFFGCWLDFNQTRQIVPFEPPATNVDGPFSGQPLLSLQEVFIRSPHQCLVAEVAFDDVPIPQGADPSISSQLAQRNLAFVDAPNPGLELSRRVPQPFEIRPTTLALAKGTPPDELMIDWGNTPAGSTAAIYLPDSSADDILKQAAALYTTHRLTRQDAHTLECPANGVTYLPIPTQITPANFAGLLSVSLPDTVKKGQAYTVVVRQFTNAFGKSAPPPPPQPKINAVSDESTTGNDQEVAWRRMMGAFQMVIPVKTKAVMLGPEERLLSGLRWIEKSIPHANRWYPVFQRYVRQIADRVKGLGGDPGLVLPSPTGEWNPPHLHHPPEPHHGHDHDHDWSIRFTGKVSGIIYDRFGDFEGFSLETESGECRIFASREIRILEIAERAWIERILTTVAVHKDAPKIPVSITLHGAVPRREP